MESAYNLGHVRFISVNRSYVFKTSSVGRCRRNGEVIRGHSHNKSEPVVAKVRYINPEWKDRIDSPRIGSRESRRKATSFQQVNIFDARKRISEGSASLDCSGFTLDGNKTSVHNFRDSDEISSIYYNEMKELICRVTGADFACIYNHLIRTEKPTNFNDGYARFVHCDYNMTVLDGFADEVFKMNGIKREKHWDFAFYNTWQPFDHPVEMNPLAFIDWETLPPDDVIDYYYTGYGKDSLVAAPVYNSTHEFCYFPIMSTEEVIVMKQLESRSNRSIYCPHTSFDEPDAPKDALPRRSIETRLLAVFDCD